MTDNLTASKDSNFSDECEGSFSNITNIELANNTLPSDLAVPLYGYALPIIVILTLVANSIIITVLTRRHMRSPTNVLLIAISLSDLMTLITPAPIFFYMYTLGHHEYPIYPISLCYTWYYFYDVIPNTFHTTSIWLTLALGVQRYMYVCHPPMARLYCSVSKVVKAVILLFLAASLHQGIRFFEFGYRETCVVWNNEEVLPACVIFFSEWITSSLNAYYALYFWFRVVAVHLGPCTSLVVLNILLFRALKRAEKKRMKLLRENRKRECLRLRDSNCTTMMLIVILSVFLITEIPLAIITLLHIFSSQEFLVVFTPYQYHIIRKFFIASNFFITLSYPINFAIYCGMSRQFLETFRETFLHHPYICKKKISNVSVPTSQRSSISALSLKQKQIVEKVSNQCCVSTIGQNDHSPEQSSKEDPDNVTQELHNKERELYHLNHSARSVSFIFEDSSRPAEASKEFEALLKSEPHGEINSPKLTTVQETEI